MDTTLSDPLIGRLLDGRYRVEAPIAHGGMASVYTALDTRAFTSSGTLADLEENTDGLRFGGGVQIQLPGPLEARVEYRRSTYKDLADAGQDRASTDQVVAGIGLRF